MTITKNYEKYTVSTLPIATLPLSNHGGISIIEIISDEVVIMQYYDNRPKGYKLYFNNKGVYFNFNGSRYYLAEFLRV